MTGALWGVLDGSITPYSNHLSSCTSIICCFSGNTLYTGADIGTWPLTVWMWTLAPKWPRWPSKLNAFSLWWSIFQALSFRSVLIGPPQSPAGLTGFLRTTLWFWWCHHIQSQWLVCSVSQVLVTFPQQHWAPRPYKQAIVNGACWWADG